MSRRLFIAAASLTSAMLGVLPAAPTARAQSTQPIKPIVFVHGEFSSSSPWQTVSQQLLAEYAIRPGHANLGYRSPFGHGLESIAEQAVELRTFVDQNGFPQGSIIVGQGTGGLVARRLNADGWTAGGLLTIGTPHQGSALAAAFVDGVPFQHWSNLFWSAHAAFSRYGQYWGGLRYFGGIAAETAAGLAHTAEGLAYGIGYAAGGTFLPDVVPGSPLFLGDAGLNTWANAPREGAMADRVSLSTTAGDRLLGIMWRGLEPENWEYLTIAQYQVTTIVVWLHRYYVNFYDPEDQDAYEKRHYAYLWAQLAGMLLGLDTRWCDWMGASEERSPCHHESDGILTVGAQQYPQATHHQALGNGPVSAWDGGIPHYEQTDAGKVAASIATILETHFGVERRITSVRVLPTSASITQGGARQLTATPLDRHGVPVPNYTASWQSSNPAVAAVSSTGNVTGVGQGTATITGSIAGFSAMSTITVLPAAPLSLGLSGPTKVEPRTTHTYTATVSGGITPYSISWQVNGATIAGATGTTFAHRNGGLAHTVGVRVVDAAGTVRTASLSVSIQCPGIGFCL